MQLAQFPSHGDIAAPMLQTNRRNETEWPLDLAYAAGTTPFGIENGATGFIDAVEQDRQ